MPLESKDLPEYTVEEVSKHKTLDDGWIVIHGGVYNVTQFIEFHPGGKAIMEQNLGTDVTEAFKEPTIHLHSEKAWRMLERYKIGTIPSKTASSATSLDEQIRLTADMDKPLVYQVYKMDEKVYQSWIHSFPPLTSIRLFETAFLEFFSRYPWWYIFPLWAPIILYNIGVDAIKTGIDPIALSSNFIWGIVFWITLEYTLHRWVFHMVTESHFGNFFHFMAHGIHHLSPMDPTRLTFPPIFSVFVVAAVYKIFSVLPITHYNVFFAGGLFGFVAYDTIHYFFHHGTLCDNIPYLKWMRSRHFRHHYVCPDKNFGVSCPIWDYLLGTSE